jgi:hypothetical protein
MDERIRLRLSQCLRISQGKFSSATYLTAIIMVFDPIITRRDATMDVKTYVLYEKLLAQQAELTTSVKELEVRTVECLSLSSLSANMMLFSEYIAYVPRTSPKAQNDMVT